MARVLSRVGLSLLFVCAGCTAIRPLDPVLDGSGIDATGSGDAGGVDASTIGDAGLDAYANDASVAPDAGTDAAVLPDTNCPAEVCGGGDEDCDGMIDEAGAVGSMAYYPDVDLDNYGDDAGLMMLCTMPPTGRWVMRGGDCDDTNRQINPGRGETCNGRDDNCNGLVDEGLAGCALTCTTATYLTHTYTFCPDTRSQAEAAAHCPPGAHLVDIGDMAENTFVEMEAAALGLGIGGAAQGVWIGLVQGSMLGSYTWTDGSVATYLNWDAGTGEPNMSGPCVRMRSSVGRWADNLCSNAYPYVCESP